MSELMVVLVNRKMDLEKDGPVTLLILGMLSYVVHSLKREMSSLTLRYLKALI